MIPANNSDLLTEDFEYIKQPSKTYKLNTEKNTISGGYIDGIEAVKQAVYKILNTERFDYIIYSWNYGVEIKNLIGQHISFAVPELERVITEALMQDDRIEEVTNFNFSINKNEIVINFKVISTEGVTSIEKVVSV